MTESYPWLARALELLLPTGLGLVLLAAGCALGWAILSYRVRRKPPVSGQESIIGRIAVARSDLSRVGMVLLDGELWQARSVAGEIPTGSRVQVTGVEGLELQVMPVSEGITPSAMPPGWLVLVSLGSRGHRKALAGKPTDSSRQLG